MKAIADTTTTTTSSTTTTTVSASAALEDSRRIKISKEVRCYPKVVVAYLKSKARNSQKIGYTYMKALLKFSRFLACQYSSFDVESIVLALEFKKVE